MLYSLTDAYGQIHSLPSLLNGSTFGNDTVIWQTESSWGSISESNEEIAQLRFGTCTILIVKLLQELGF